VYAVPYGPVDFELEIPYLDPVAMTLSWLISQVWKQLLEARGRSIRGPNPFRSHRRRVWEVFAFHRVFLRLGLCLNLVHFGADEME
jgi:hypothetical protein